MKEITSINNPLIKELVLLKNKKQRIVEKKFIVEGYHLVEEAYKRGLLIQVLTTNDQINYSDIEIIKTTDLVIKKLSSTIEPQGIVGIVRMQQRQIKKQYQKYLLLDDVADPGNLGTIIRSSLALGIDALIVSEATVDEYNDKVVRASQGAIFKLPIIRMDLEKAIKTLQEQNIVVYAAAVRNAVDLTKINRTNRFGLILGNEARGIKEEYLNLANQVVKIAMASDVESLNVAMSGGIILYYLMNK